MESRDSHNRTPLTVRILRRRWKPRKERLLALQSDHPTHIRFHRACSWLQKVEQAKERDALDADTVLIDQWVAFNALYGQWHAGKNEPRPDCQSWKAFLRAMMKLDDSGHVCGKLLTHRRLVMSILDDAYIGRFFWSEPSPEKAREATHNRKQAEVWYDEKQYKPILTATTNNIYAMRCQLIHGASTHGSRLNRKSLERCSRMLGYLMEAYLLVWIDHAEHEDWGEMCYPPQH